MPTLYHDHGNFGKSTTIFSDMFIKISYHPESKKTFWGKFCIEVLFNNCFSIQHKNTSKI